MNSHPISKPIKRPPNRFGRGRTASEYTSEQLQFIVTRCLPVIYIFVTDPNPNDIADFLLTSDVAFSVHE